jgi:hypothetical protein
MAACSTNFCRAQAQLTPGFCYRVRLLALQGGLGWDVSGRPAKRVKLISDMVPPTNKSRIRSQGLVRSEDGGAAFDDATYRVNAIGSLRQQGIVGAYRGWLRRIRFCCSRKDQSH